MIKSMTGFGRVREVREAAAGENGGREIIAEVKSVNSRYIDVLVRAPRVYGFLEEKIKREAAKQISRGKVEVYVYIEEKSGDGTKISLNEAYLKNYVAVLRKIRDDYDLPDDISTMRVAQNRDIYNIEKLEEDEEVIWAAVKAVLDKAFGAFNAMREAEGAELLADMAARIENCGRIADGIKILADSGRDDYYAKLQQKLREIINNAGAAIDDGRILTEAAVYADKTDISEEVVRLKSHFAQFGKIVREKNPVGRKLDFLVQEINREVNTIGSKSTELEITNLVIEVKSDVEKIREQLQNIE